MCARFTVNGRHEIREGGGQRSGHLIWDRGDVRSQERTQHARVPLKITEVIVFKKEMHMHQGSDVSLMDDLRC